jgi:hypothetical protein
MKDNINIHYNLPRTVSKNLCRLSQKANITPAMMTSRHTYIYKLTILNFSEHQALISQVDLKTD